MTHYVRRPWINYFDKLIHSNDQLDQQCKLIRNQIASLDIGNPSFRLYDSYYDRNNQRRATKPSSRELYLEWVADWKRTYSLLSDTIRSLKHQRHREGFRRVREDVAKNNKSWGNLADEELFLRNQSRVRVALDALKIAAQVMLNARYVAKLASAELRRRRVEQALREAA